MNWLQKLGGKILGGGVPNTDKVLDEAIAKVQQGQGVDAVAQMNDAVQKTKQIAGERSVEYAKARFNQGTLKLVMGDADSAAADCQAAADLCPDSPQGRKDRLTYLMNTGQMLVRCDKVNQAVAILETGLRERIALYGNGHAGVAYGQQVLAEALLSAGRFQEGVPLAKQAAQIFGKEKHQEYPVTLPLYAALLSATGDDPRAALDSFPLQCQRPWLDTLVQSAIEVCKVMPNHSGVRFAEQFAEWADASLPEKDPHRLNTLAALGNLAADRNAPDARCRAADRMVEAAQEYGQPRVLINAFEGRCYAMSAAGAEPKRIRADYEAALRVAEEAKLSEEIPGVLRNWAIWEADQGQDRAAARLYDQAIQEAQSGTDRELLHRVQIAAGIFHQHRGQMEQAEQLLSQGIAGLPASHSDVACGILHQVALQEKIPCPCAPGQTPNPEALAVLAKKFFAESGLGDLVKTVSCGTGEEDGGLSVELGRPPTNDELERLQIAHQVLLGIIGASAKQTR